MMRSAAASQGRGLHHTAGPEGARGPAGSRGRGAPRGGAAPPEASPRPASTATALVPGPEASPWSASTPGGGRGQGGNRVERRRGGAAGGGLPRAPRARRRPPRRGGLRRLVLDWPLALKHLHVHPHPLAEAGGREATASSVGAASPRRAAACARGPGPRRGPRRARPTWPLVQQHPHSPEQALREAGGRAGPASSGAAAARRRAAARAGRGARGGAGSVRPRENPLAHAAATHRDPPRGPGLMHREGPLTALAGGPPASLHRASARSSTGCWALDRALSGDQADICRGTVGSEARKV
jgi:hypothetical protein